MPEIHIDVVAELHRRSTQRVAKEIQAKFDKVGFEVTPELDKTEVRAVAAYLDKQFKNIHTEVKVDIDRGAINRVNQLGRTLDNLSDTMNTFGRATASSTDSLGELGRSAFQTSRGLLTLGVPIAAIVAIDFGKWAVQATGALGLLPAAAAAGAAGIGTLAIATQGFGDTIKDMGDPKKFAEGLALLSPNAQQAALEIKALVDGPLGELKRATQDAFFANWPEQLHNLTSSLGPALQQMTTSISTSFNQMFLGITDQMMTPEGTAQLQTIFANLSQTFQNLVPAATSFSQALMDITEAGSGFLPGIADSVSGLAQDFADFIREAKESGKLGEWIQTGIDAISMLADELWDITGLVMQLFGAGGDGQASIDSFKDDLESIKDILRLLNGDFSEIGNEFTLQFNKWGEDLKQAMTGAVNHVSKVINTWLDAMSHIPILGGAVPDVRLPEFNTSSGLGGGGGSFGAPVGGPGPRRGGIGDVPQTDWRNRAGPTRGGYPQRAVPGVPPGGGAGGKRGELDAIIAGLDPSTWRVDPFAGMPALPPTGPLGGPGAMTAQDYLEAQHKIMSEAHDVEEATKERLALEKSTTATQEEINDAKYKELEEGWGLQKAQADLVEKATKAAKDTKSAMNELGVALDPDFGISKGLAGLAENLVKFVGSLAAAPMMGKMAAASAMDPIQGGYGLAGMASARDIAAGGSGLGPFGGLLQGMYDRAAGTTGGATTAGAAPLSGYGITTPTNAGAMTGGGFGTVGGAVGPPKQGESARDFAHRVMMPYWESQGLTAGDHAADYAGEHQFGALDIMVKDLAEGQRVLQQVLADPNVYGAIFNNQTYGYGRPGMAAQDYSAGHTGDPSQDHLNHVHAWYRPGMGGGGSPGPGAATTGGNTSMPSMGPPPPQTQHGPQPPWWGPSRAKGGPVPIMAHGGEYVVNANATSRFGPLLDRINGFASGGMVDQYGNPVAAGPAPGPTYGGAAPPSIQGGGGAGITPGGTIDTAISAAASAADLIAPGSSQAIQMGMKLANRAIEYGGQVAGIGVSGLMETFLPTGGSELANNNWLTRIGGALASAAPALPNLAGQQGVAGQPGVPGGTQADASVMVAPPITPQQVANAPGQRPGVGQALTNNVTVNDQRHDPDRLAGDIGHHLGEMNKSTAMNVGAGLGR